MRGREKRCHPEKDLERSRNMGLGERGEGRANLGKRKTRRRKER